MRVALALTTSLLATSFASACPPGIDVHLFEPRTSPFRVAPLAKVEMKPAPLFAFTDIVIAGPPHLARSIRHSLDDDTDRLDHCALLVDVPVTATFRITASGETTNVSVTPANECVADRLDMLRFRRASSDAFVRVTVKPR